MRRIASIALLVASLSPVAAAGVNSTDREAARRLTQIIKEVDLKAAGGTFRRIGERAVELNPRDTKARKLMGYEKVKGKWERTREETSRINTLVDGDLAVALELRRQAREVEAWRAQRIAKSMEDEPIDEKRREILLGLLARAPKEEAVHELLGHEHVGFVWVRPELSALVENRAAIEAKWAACREPVEVTKLENEPKIPGVQDPMPFYLAEPRHVAGVMPDEEDVVRFAATVNAPGALLGLLFPEENLVPMPLNVYILHMKDYRRMIRALYPSEEQRERMLRYTSYIHPEREFFAMQEHDLVRAKDVWAHSTGHYQGKVLVEPEIEEGKWDPIAHAWAKEGLGYFLSLELYDTAIAFFASPTETGEKLRWSTPPPEVQSRASLTEWVRDQILDGTAIPLRQVFGRTLNSLDFLASMEGWTFLRFLALYDPEAFGTFPLTLSKLKTGSYPDRTDKALKETFGKGTEEMEALWRAYLLEIE